jgi:hypothetical protein
MKTPVDTPVVQRETGAPARFETTARPPGLAKRGRWILLGSTARTSSADALSMVARRR